MSVLAGAVEGSRTPRADQDLVAACLGGDEQAWHELIDRYARLIFSIPIKHGLGRDEAADIFQAVCLDLVTDLPQLRDPQALPAWLIQTTAHKVIRWKRRHRRDAAPERGHAEETPAPESDMPDTLLRQLQQGQAVRAAVAALPPRCREMVRMLFFETPPRPYRDVSAQLGVALGSIGFMRSRCLDRLRSALQRIGL